MAKHNGSQSLEMDMTAHRELPKNTPVFFKVRPKTEYTPPDAAYVRLHSFLPNGQEVHVIKWHGEDWKVGPGDFLTHQEAMKATALKHRQDIDSFRRPGMKLKELAKAMGISETTLRKRLGMIQNHIPANE